MTRRSLFPAFAGLIAAAARAMSPQEGRAAAEKLDRIVENGLGPGESMTLTDEEINSYLHYEYASEMPAGVRGLRVKFDRDLGVVTGFADLSKMPADGPARFVLMMLRGERPFTARCRYTSQAGMARLDIESFQIDGREMKGVLLDWAVDTYVAPRMDGFALGRPFPLGHNLEQVRLEPGRAIAVANAATARR